MIWAFGYGIAWMAVLMVAPWQSSRYLMAKNEHVKMKGFAHVYFDSKEAVDKAIEKNGEMLGGRELRIDASTSKGGHGNKRGGFQRGRGRARGGNVDPLEKAKKTGAVITGGESKVVKFEDSDDDDDE